jgi:flagellar biosynthesis GTPase FlhF
MAKKFVTPKASKKSLEKLLEYLGDRAGDFRKCFDTGSKWCLKYADLVLRGLEDRKLEYAERHHIVPRCFYGCRRDAKKGCAGNMTKLSYSEHVYAHYCAAQCSLETIKNGMVVAFCRMYADGTKNKIHTIPEECEFLEVLSEHEYKHIRAMHDRVAAVDAEGRTHWFDDPVAHKKELQLRYRDIGNTKRRARYAANKEEELERRHQYYAENKETISQKSHERYSNNREERCRKAKEYRCTNHETVRTREKKYASTHKKERAASNKKWREENKERNAANQKRWREENKEHVAKKNQEWVENNREKSNQIKRKWAKKNKKKVKETQRQYRERNKEKLKKKYDDKVAAGYRYRFDPVAGKNRWVFVGIPGETK